MNKFYIKTMGCKSNQFEGQIVAQKLVENGYTQVQDFKDADIYILNSCSVTHKSDNEAMYYLRQAHGLGLKTVLTGCIAQIDGVNKREDSFIDYVIGNEDKFKLAEYLEKEETFIVSDLMNKKEFCKVTLEDTAKTRINLKIQDGCDYRCSYCIIPFGRGKSRSANEDFIINEINKYSSNGYKEVVLTGIHIGLYGRDIGTNILNLLKKIENETTIKRYRLGSLTPHEISKELLNFLQTSEKFCPHFHLSLQSACDKTLKSMNRHYSARFFLEQIEDITTRFTNPFIGSDIIAGFVGETEEDFETTVENLNNSKLSRIHTFPYSVRKGTAAERMEGHLPDSVKEERANIIKEISKEKYDKFLNSNLDSVQQVLIEKHLDKKTGMYKGLTGNYINVLIPYNDKNKFNTLTDVKLIKLQEDRVIGEGI